MKLTRSKYLNGTQCPKMLWMQTHEPEKDTSVIDDSLLENAKLVLNAACAYFNCAAVVEQQMNADAMCADTDSFIDRGEKTIARATFRCDDYYCTADILRLLDDDTVELYKVTSSTKCKPQHITELAYCCYVLSECGMTVSKAAVMRIDNSYVRSGELELDKLFALEDHTNEALSQNDYVDDIIKKLDAYCQQPSEPLLDIGVQCDSPYECVYKEYCWRSVPAGSIFEMTDMLAKTKFGHYFNGIQTLQDLSNSKAKLTPNQRKQLDVLLGGNDIVDKQGI